MIEKAIKHLKWRFSQDRITISKKDLEGLNEIIKMHNEVQSKTLTNHKLFLKLFIDSFLKHTTRTGKNSQETLREMERLLAIPLSEYYEKMKSEIPLLRFHAVTEKIEITPLYKVMRNGKIKVNNSEVVIESNRKKIRQNQKLLKTALTREFSDKELQNFLSNQVFSMILKYSKYE